MSTDPDRQALTGLYVSPRGKLTSATNGSMLVEVTALVQGPSDKDPEPFILPAKVAQQLAKELSEDATVQVGLNKFEPTLTIKNGKKSTPFPFDPIEARYPDTQKANLWSGKGDPISLTCDAEYVLDVLRAAAAGKTVHVALFGDRIRFESEPRVVSMAVGTPATASEGPIVAFNSEYLRQVLSATAIGKSVTLSLWGDRLRVESKKDDGQSARGVLMCWGPPSTGKVQAAAPAKTKAPAVEPKTEVQAPEAKKPDPVKAKPKPVVETPSQPSSSGFRWWGKRRKTFAPKDVDATRPATDLQRMFYTYLLRRHDEEITPEILESTDCVGKIEELKKGLSYDQTFATWPQWKKVNYLLLERKAEPETVCEVLNGISDMETASEAIKAWIKKPVPVAA